MPSEPGKTPAQLREQAQGVLRYWLAAIRLEEALTARPKARRPMRRMPKVDVLDPGQGQAYFRLGAEHADFWLRERGGLSAGVDAGVLRFFERWLSNAYRADAAVAVGREARPAGWVAGWPTFHFTRRQELATLIRFPVEVSWWHGAKPWARPSYAARMRKAQVELPESVRARASEASTEPGALPVSVDRLLLGRVLGVDEQALDRAEAGWRRGASVPEIVRDVVGLLGQDAPDDEAGAPELFAALTRAVQERLPNGVDAHPVGIVQDSLLMLTTFHLQKEFGALVEDESPKALAPGRPLAAYLGGASSTAGWRPMLGRLRPRGITQSQRMAAETTLGSVLAAVQGPPGTGKTELILNLAAHHLVERIDGLVDEGVMPDGPMLVSSTNNRAVDNALDPLGADADPERLPLALRAGSQEVTGTATAAMLQRAHAWIESQPSKGAAKRLKKAQAEFQSLREAFSKAAPTGPGSAEDAELEALAHAAFEAAVEVREAWAVKHRKALVAALALATASATDRRSLRRFIEAEPKQGRWILQLFPVLGSTLLSLGNVLEAEPGTIERLVVDEAGQCHPAYAVSGLCRARQALLIGDVDQLPPVVQLGEVDEARVRPTLDKAVGATRAKAYAVHERSGVSAQSLGDAAVAVRPRLVDHFRCQPEIIALSDALCGYGLTVRTPARSRTDEVPWLKAPLLFDAVPGAQAPARGSWVNEAEARRVLAAVEALLEAGIGPDDIGVLTPYAAQLDLLRRQMRARRLPIEANGEHTLDLFAPVRTAAPGTLGIGTVHRFQGGERSVVVFSTVVTEPGRLAFIDSQVNLLNVAVSRAREHLLVFGHEAALRAGQRTRLLVERATPLRG